MERNVLVDRLKGYACFLVLFGHVIMGIRLAGIDIPCFFEGVEKFLDGGGAKHLICAYQGDELKYTGSLYEKYGCEYNANDPLPLYPWCNQWNILAHGYLGPREPLYGAKTTIYQLGEDTIINHLRYKQLTRYASDDVNQTKTYVGAIRFTKNNRQIYEKRRMYR